MKENTLDNVLIEGLTETTAANDLINFWDLFFNLLISSIINALENVALPLYYQGLGRKVRQVKALQYLEKVGLKDWATHLPSELSGGQKTKGCYCTSHGFSTQSFTG